MNRSASALWKGGLKDGEGFLSAPSQVLAETPYSFGTRFDGVPGTNPEELLAAAHAGCFSMALSAQLGEVGLTAESIETKATVTLDKVADGFSITKVHLDVTVTIPGGDKQKFDQAAHAAKVGCPVSKLFNAEITMDARLIS